MAAMLSYYDIDYYIASEELEPGIGWHYTSWLEKLGKQPDMTAEELCGCIVDNYMEAGLKETPDDYLTLSVISLHEMGNLQEAVEKLASTMLGELQQGNVADLRRERSRMYSFGSYVDGSWDMVDMGAMLDAYARHDAENAALARKQLSKAGFDMGHWTLTKRMKTPFMDFLKDIASSYKDYHLVNLIQIG
jgi:hypothetical protein